MEPLHITRSSHAEPTVGLAASVVNDTGIVATFEGLPGGGLSSMIIDARLVSDLFAVKIDG